MKFSSNLFEFKLFLTVKQSVEEIKSHTIDEDLNDFKKTIILLKSNYEAQLLCGIKSIPDLLKQDKQCCIQKVFPDFKVIQQHHKSNKFHS